MPLSESDDLEAEAVIAHLGDLIDEARFNQFAQKSMSSATRYFQRVCNFIQRKPSLRACQQLNNLQATFERAGHSISIRSAWSPLHHRGSYGIGCVGHSLTKPPVPSRAASAFTRR